MNAGHKGVQYAVAITPVGQEHWDWSWSCVNAPLRGRNVEQWASSRSEAEREAVADAHRGIDQWLEKQAGNFPDARSAAS